MKINKFFAVLFASLFLFTGVALAHDNDNDQNKINIDKFAFGGSYDFDVAVSNHWHGNDKAIAGGGSGGIVVNEGAAEGKTVFGLGLAHISGQTNADAFAKDFGTTSVAGAVVGTEVHAVAFGVTGFLNEQESRRYNDDRRRGDDGKAYNKSFAEISGDVCQYNTAQEVGYSSGTFAKAENASGASFEAKTSDFDKTDRRGENIADSKICLYGTAWTAGGSIASVDPTGSNQSAFAATGNIAYADVKGADCAKTNVWGEGQVATGAFAEKNGAVAGAGGSASFSYQGKEFGAGGAVMNSTVHAGNNSFSATSTGAAFATSK